MASKRRLRRKQCEGKKRFTSKAKAIDGATSYLRTFGTWKNVYHCQFCKGWHFGSKPFKMKGSPERLAYYRNGRR